MTDPTPSSADTGPSAPVTMTRKGTAPGTVSKQTPQQRLQREAAIRRALFAGSLAGFVAIFGLVASAGKPAEAVDVPEPAIVRSPNSSNQVLAEVPLGDVTGNGGRETIVRIIAPQLQSPVPHVRTRATS
jgi:hypothetical protein